MSRKDKAPLTRQEKVRAMAQQKSRADLLRKNLFGIGLFSVAALLLAVAIFSARQATPEYSDALVAPENVNKGYGISYTPEDAGSTATGTKPVKLTIYEDFQCPACQQFEELYGPQLEKYVDAGQVTMEFRPVAFLDNMGASLNEYGRRAANAALCVRDAEGASGYKKFHDYLYENQPEERTDGPKDSALFAAAEKIAPTVSEACVMDRKYVPWMEKATEAFSARPDISGTPSVFIDGKLTDTAEVPAKLAAAVKASAK